MSVIGYQPKGFVAIRCVCGAGFAHSDDHRQHMRKGCPGEIVPLDEAAALAEMRREHDDAVRDIRKLFRNRRRGS